MSDSIAKLAAAAAIRKAAEQALFCVKSKMWSSLPKWQDYMRMLLTAKAQNKSIKVLDLHKFFEAAAAVSARSAGNQGRDWPSSSPITAAQKVSLGDI